MQSFPYAAPPLGAGGAPVPGISHVPGPQYPSGVSPSLTQYPTAPAGGYPSGGFSPGFPQPQQGGAPFSTYQGSMAPPQVSRMPGPATLGPGPAPGAGGVAGVGVGQVAGIAPPAASGGPHPLPSLPQLPLPQGFPNPFEMQQLSQAQQPQGNPQPPGITSVTGPQGYLPGIGYFGSPGTPGPQAPAPTAFPVLPGALQQQAQAPYPYRPQPQAIPQPQPQAFPQQAAPPPQPAPQQAAPQQAQPQGGPFWLQLAWQLVQTPAVKAALGDQLQTLLADDVRARTLQVAAGCLTSQELQAAFRSLTSGALDQTRFTELFAERLKTALQGAVAASR